MPRHPAFPNVPADQMVGPLAGRRFMESFNDTTLPGMARGRAGEPLGVVSLAKHILQCRSFERGEPVEKVYPGSVKSDEDKALFDRLRYIADTGHKSDRGAAILILQNKFGFNWHREVRS
jgi:hypothetical protein